MTDVDDAIERAENPPDWDMAGRVADLRILATEVKKLRQELADCRKGIVRWKEGG